MVQYVMTVFVSSTPAASNTARSRIRVFERSVFAAQRIHGDMHGARNVSRAPRVLCRARRPEPLTDVLRTRAHIEHEISRVPMADSTSCREARTSELGAERTYEVSAGSDTFVVHALP